MKAIHPLVRLAVLALFWIDFLAARNVFPQPIDSIKGPLCVVYDTVTKKSFTLSPERSLYNVVVTDGLAHVKIEQ